MLRVEDILRAAVESAASDIFIGAGRNVLFKKNGVITPYTKEAIDTYGAEKLITGLYEMAYRPMDKYIETGDDDFSLSVSDLARFRVCAYRQRSSMAAAIRVVLFNIPFYKDINIPEEVMKISYEQQGLILVTGAAGNGKTTTLACIVDAINRTRNCHIITLEEPIEYLHKDQESLISQREIPTDSASYIKALRACLRQAPDVILIGEMRDHETIKTAVTAAETGHLVISTLHTVGAVNTINRIIDVFPPEQQQQIRVQIAAQLKTVVSQKLLRGKTGGFIPAFEIMLLNNSVRSLIRENKTHQLEGVIQTSANEGMISMDAYIFMLYQTGLVTKEAAVSSAQNPVQMVRRIN